MCRQNCYTLIFVCVLLAACYIWLMPGLNVPAPDIDFTTTDGEQIKLHALKGQAILLTFWSTSCAICVHEIPALNQLYADLAAAGLVLIAINVPSDRPDHVLAMIKSRSIQYPVALDIQGQVIKSFNAIATMPDIRVTPTSILINKDNNIIQFNIGALDMVKLRADIQALL